jgi:hypothetical protein
MTGITPTKTAISTYSMQRLPASSATQRRRAPPLRAFSGAAPAPGRWRSAALGFLLRLIPSIRMMGSSSKPCAPSAACTRGWNRSAFARPPASRSTCGCRLRLHAGSCRLPSPLALATGYRRAACLKNAMSEERHVSAKGMARPNALRPWPPRPRRRRVDDESFVEQQDRVGIRGCEALTRILRLEARL